jgi:hypothetical protein
MKLVEPILVKSICAMITCTENYTYIDLVLAGKFIKLNISGPLSYVISTTLSNLLLLTLI